MKTTIWLITLIVIGSLMSAKAYPTSFALNTPGSDNEYEALMQKIRLDFAKNPSIDKDLKTYNEADGSFTDVDYASIERTNWPPMKHIDRLSDLSLIHI